MSTDTDDALDTIARHVDLSQRTECHRCDGEGEITVKTKAGSHYPNSTGPGIERRPCPEDCDEGWYTLREYADKYGLDELLDHPSVYRQMPDQALSKVWEVAS